VEEDFIKGFRKGITFFTGRSGEGRDVPFYNHIQFNVAGIQNFSDVFSPVLLKIGILPFHADGFADECEPLPTWQFSSQQK